MPSVWGSLKTVLLRRGEHCAEGGLVSPRRLLKNSSQNLRPGTCEVGRVLTRGLLLLGCVVNGPGEASEADIGIAAGKGVGILYRKGEVVRRIKEEEIVSALLEEVERFQPE